MGRLESAVHIIKPAGLEAKAAICEFDYTGTGFTVVQNRVNDTSFSGNWNNGFGETVGYDDAACAVSNYWLGNKYVKKLASESGAALRATKSGGVYQWNSVRAGSNFNLGSGDMFVVQIIYKEVTFEW